MSVLVLGFCGSMGKRRIRCLRRLGVKHIFGYDIHPQKEEIANDLKINLLESIDDFPGVHVIISTPPDCHIDYSKHFLNKGCHVFCEASVVPSDRKHYEEIKLLSSEKNVVFFPSATIKFKDSIRYLRKQIDRIGKVHSYDYRFAQNLRTWHPDQDIKDFYVSNPETSASREMTAFELSWLTDLFGSDARVCGSVNVGLSEISDSTGINDVSAFLLTHSVGILGSIVIDVFSHKPYRVLRISGSKGNIEFDWIENYVKTFDTSGSLIDTFKEENTEVHEGYTQFSTEKMYDNEVASFLDSCKSPSLPAECTIEEDYAILELVESIEQFSGV